MQMRWFGKSKGKWSRGSVLLIVMVGMTVMGLTLGSFLHLVSNQNQSINRSQAWNKGLPVAEAGIEEGMAHLNYNTTNRTYDSWTIDGTNVYKKRDFGSERYEVWINKDVEPPLILAKGYTRASNGQGEIVRTVRVGTTNDALFAKGMVAKGQIDLAGKKLMTDSYDSLNTNYSTAGMYDPAKRKAGGDVATNSSVVDSLNVWNASIYGKASTGPGGTVRIGPNGVIGDLNWHASGNTGIQPGYARDDMNVDFPDVKLPPGPWWNPPMWVSITNATTLAVDTYKYVLGDGNWNLTELNLSGSDKVLVTGNAVLHVTAGINTTGTSEIIIDHGAHLDLYMSGGSAKFAGNGIVNRTGSAFNFNYWGLNSNTGVEMTGNAAFVGTVYAPNASLALKGGGSTTTVDFNGAAVAKSVKMGGNYNFHYDEALGAWGPRRGYTVISWNETIAWEEL